MRRLALTVAVVGLAVATAAGQPQRAARADRAEAATARRFAAIRNDPLALRAFLREMPKGGDLHNHLSGSIYAESFLRWAAEDRLCFVVETSTIAAGPCDAAAGKPPAATLLQNSSLYNRAIDAMSMRNWDPSRNGHDHFFEAFGRFNAVSSGRPADMLAEVASRAAGERVSYLELMMSVSAVTAAQFSTRLEPLTGPSPDLAQARERLLTAGFAEAVKKEATTRLDTVETRQRALLKCGTPQADAGCHVTIRFIAPATRASAPELVFAQLVAGFELASGAEPRVVSVNLLQPEDDPIALRDFRLQMSMIDYLHRQYPRVPITLHAGELTDGLVPPEALRFHVRESMHRGHATRIGHATALFSEEDPYGLLAEMAAGKVLVEVALSSGESILGVTGKRHPLRAFLQHGVPVALVTDDMGVARSTHTEEFAKAVEEHGLDYLTLKRLARNSLAYAFADPATRTRLKTELESALHAFERRHLRPAPKS
jgi:hypothetical protein